MLKNVVLPAPFGPIRLTIEPLRDREVEVVDGDEAAELLAHARRDQQIALAGGGGVASAGAVGCSLILSASCPGEPRSPAPGSSAPRIS